MLRSAIERQFQIIGEALQQLSRHHPELATQISDHRAIINFRNILVHGYDVVEHDTVWGLVVGHLGKLREEVAELLSRQRPK